MSRVRPLSNLGEKINDPMIATFSKFSAENILE
jgi:hypothetical protein